MDADRYRHIGHGDYLVNLSAYGAEREVKIMYVIQYLDYPTWKNKWMPTKKRYPTLKEAQAAFNALPIKSDHRIAEEYTVVRYKAISTK
jgi:hypothetical protein